MSLDVKLGTTPLEKTKADLIALPVTEEYVKKTGPALSKLDKALRGQLVAAIKADHFSGKSGETLSFHALGKLGAAKIVLVGLGKKEKADLEALRKAAGTVAKAAFKARAKTLTFSLPGFASGPDELRAATEGLLLGSYRFDKWKTGEESKRTGPKTATICAPELKAKDPAVAAALKLGRETGAAVAWARDLVNEPPITLTPKALAAQAKALLEAAGCKVDVQGKAAIQKLNMGMFLGVAQGSIEEPQFVVAKYIPADPAHAKRAPLAIIGKAITFDSGGLSLKPADAMIDMKTDMAGSAAAFGALHVIATAVKPPFPVHVYVGTCENMPSGTAYRPGDILKARNGKTVEITNTDAEGRLVLGDVLTFASEDKPCGMVDLATLTGACIVALGMYTTGAFGKDDAWVGKVMDAAKVAGEDFHRLPMVPGVKENLKSDVADMKNSGSRWGGAISAAHFLAEFTGDTPWCHLDIAGPSTSDKDAGYLAKGGTGVGIRALVELARGLAAEG